MLKHIKENKLVMNFKNRKSQQGNKTYLKLKIIERKNTISEIKIHQICKLQFQPKDEREKKIKKAEQNLSDLWDNMIRSNIHEILVPEGEEKENGAEKYLKN